MRSGARSRPLRLAARLRPDAPETSIRDRFGEARVAVRLAPALEDWLDARTTFLALTNHVLRFCPRVLAATDDSDLLTAACALGPAIVGAEDAVTPVSPDYAGEADVIVSVDVEGRNDRSWVTVNSVGWVARVASGGHAGPLPGAPGPATH